MADTTRRIFIRSAASTVALASFLKKSTSSSLAADKPFDIDATFADFVKGIGGTAEDAGGTVVFTGRDPIVRSHFRIGAAMAIPAMGAALGAAAIWRERTGQEQDLSVDLRESIYNVNPLIGMILRLQQRAGLIPPSDPLPANFNFLNPTVNELLLQAPVQAEHCI